MLKMQTPKWVKKYGLSTLAAGFAFLALPVAADASDFGDELLTEGIEDTHVEKLEDLLIEEDQLDEKSANGVYNNETTEAVKSFQEENDLLADGLAGPQTLGALQVLEEGDENALVEDLQETLEDAGHYSGEADGYFDAETHNAVENFQEAADIAVDGLAGPETYGALYYETTVTEKEAKAEEATEEEVTQGESNEESSQEETVEETPETESTENEATSAETMEEASSNDSESSSESPEGTTYQMEATAYTAECAGCSGITATGKDLRNDRNANVVAVDPDVIPLGSTVHVEGYGEAVAADTGGAINGEAIDLHVPTKEEARTFGRQNLEVTVLD